MQNNNNNNDNNNNNNSLISESLVILIKRHLYSITEVEFGSKKKKSRTLVAPKYIISNVCIQIKCKLLSLLQGALLSVCAWEGHYSFYHFSGAKK